MANSTMGFEEWLAQASEEELIKASLFRYHYPREVTIENPVTNQQRDSVECGCAPGWGYEFGSENHQSMRVIDDESMMSDL